MSDLKSRCPDCGMINYQYIHAVDECGIGVDIPNGKYECKCQPSGYRNDDKKPEKYCGKKYSVKVSTKIEVIQ